MSSSAISLEHVSVVLGGRVITREVTLDVPRGHWCALVGPNGCGKSTTLRTIMGLAPLKSGVIRVDGEPTASMPLRALVRRVGYVPQRIGEVPPLTVRAFLATSTYADGTGWFGPSAESLERIEPSLDEAGVRPLADRSLDLLSGGELQRVMIAGMLAIGAGTLLLDEPTAYLDPRARAEVIGLFSRLKAAGRSVLLVTHDLDLAVRTSDTVFAMKEGRILGSAAAIDDGVIQLFEGSFDTKFKRVVVDGASYIIHGDVA